MNETTIRSLLHQIVSEAPAPAPVDVARVVAVSEAHRRRRTWSVVASAAAVVLLVTLSAAGLAAGAHTDRAAPPADRSVPAPVAGYSLPATAPTRFDVARSQVSVAGIPADLPVRYTSTRGDQLTIGASHADASVSVVVGAKGYDLPQHSAFVATGPAAVLIGPDLRGHASTWYGDGHGEYTLLWQWAPDAWAQVVVRNRPDPLALATRLALATSLDLGTRTRLPFAVTTPPGHHLTEFLTTDGPALLPAASVTFTGPASTFVSVTANLLGAGFGEPTETIQGRPARVTQAGDHTTVVMAAGDLRATGTCHYRPNPTRSAEVFRQLCRATTASVTRTADLRTPRSWPPYSPR